MSTFEELNQDMISLLFIANVNFKITDLWLLPPTTVLISVIL